MYTRFGVMKECLDGNTIGKEYEYISYTLRVGLTIL
jgi:hypothetical protein